MHDELNEYKKNDPIQLNLFSLILRTRFYITEPIICTHMHNTYTHRGYQQSNLNNANVNKFTHAHAYTHVLWVIILKTQCSKFIFFSNISELHWQLFTILCFYFVDLVIFSLAFVTLFVTTLINSVMLGSSHMFVLQ